MNYINNQLNKSVTEKEKIYLNFNEIIFIHTDVRVLNVFENNFVLDYYHQVSMCSQDVKMYIINY